MLFRCAIPVCILSIAAASAQEAVTSDQAAFFETHIRPVLAESCFDCHNSDHAENGLDLSSRSSMLRGGELGAVIQPGRPQDSLLMRVLNHDAFIRMPPKDKLPSAVIAHFATWIRMGAPWPGATSEEPQRPDPSPSDSVRFTERQLQHWAFQPVSDPAPPDVASDWPAGGIDRFVLQRLQDAGQTPAPPADRRTLIRRATYDLTGLPPTPEETAAFLADSSPDAFARVIDRLLASPRYGEHWGRHWLDVVRYADSNGLDENLSYANAWRYRDYVIDAFNTDRPWARFVQEQVAGDLLPPPDDDPNDLSRLTATGFLAIGPKMLAEDDPVKMQMDIIDEQLSTLCQAFMGLTIGCARCHDHKFDPLPTEDYYALAGIFKSTKTMENHQVVAVWYERPLVPPHVLKEIETARRLEKETQGRIDRFCKDRRMRIAADMRQRLDRYLLAAAELHRASRTLTRRSHAFTKQTAPFPVTGKAVAIEAEAFHRGHAEADTTSYGRDIGIILSRGPAFVEYDLEVPVPGDYALELRLAAAASRPLRLSVNGIPAGRPVAGQVTGGWFPKEQRWFPAGIAALKAGRNTIRLERDGVFPHVDQLLLVPTDSAGPPVSCLQTRVQPYGVSTDLAERWRQFLFTTDPDELSRFPGLTLWPRLCRLNEESFADELPALLTERPGIPPPLRSALEQSQPESAAQAAAVYRQVVALSADRLPEPWFSDDSPLSGPVRLQDGDLPPGDREEYRRYRTQLARCARQQAGHAMAMGVTEAAPEDLKVHLRGSHLTTGKTAPRGYPQIIGPLNAPAIDPDHSGRLELAQWMTDPAHPLLWRVIVNRVWHWHFGRGLVPSVDNFGILGEPPTHPELLDWLTSRFLESGGSLKELHRRILLSRTWQMSSRHRKTAETADPNNHLLWRFRRRRLTAEELRDSVIALGTGLDLTTGGSLLTIENRQYVTNSGSNLTTEFLSRRRSVYLPVIRSAVFDVLQVFDFPDPAAAAGIRQTSTTAPQALMLLNSEFMEEQTRAMAKKLLTIPDDRNRIRALYKSALSRSPTGEEVQAIMEFVQTMRHSAPDSNDDIALQTWQSCCRALISSNEFVYVE